MSDRHTERMTDKEIAFLTGSGIILIVGATWYIAGAAKAVLLLGALLFIAGLVCA